MRKGLVFQREKMIVMIIGLLELGVVRKGKEEKKKKKRVKQKQRDNGIFRVWLVVVKDARECNKMWRRKMEKQVLWICVLYFLFL